jgi:hypothetical protein
MVEAMVLQQRSGVKSRSMTLSVDGVMMTVGNSLQRLSTLRVVWQEEEEEAWGDGSRSGMAAENAR